jgi:hypothetical protein
MTIPFEKLKARLLAIRGSKRSTIRSRRSSRLPPNCLELACEQASCKPN